MANRHKPSFLSFSFYRTAASMFCFCVSIVSVDFELCCWLYLVLVLLLLVGILRKGIDVCVEAYVGVCFYFFISLLAAVVVTGHFY